MVRFVPNHEHRRRWPWISVPLVLLITVGIVTLDVKDLCAHNPHDVIDDVAISPAYDRDQTVFILSAHRVLRSVDGGASWKLLVNGLNFHCNLNSLAISPAYGMDGTLYLATRTRGIYRSVNRGDTWEPANAGLDALDTTWIAIHPAFDYRTNARDGAQPRIVLAALAGGGLYWTKTGGEHWSQVVDDHITVSALAFSPDRERATAFLGDKNGILYASDDAGRSWRQIARLPQDAGQITAIAVSPEFGRDDTLLVGTERMGIFKSSDRGRSWSATNKGLPMGFKGRFGTFRISRDGPPLRKSEQTVISIAFAQGTGGTVLFASLWNQAIYRSDDGGRTWARHPVGLTCDYQADSSAHLSPHFRTIQVSNAFAAKASGAGDETIFLGGFDGLFKSSDGGRHWTELETLAERLMAGVALSPGDSGFPSIAIITYGGGIYTSDNAGKTWAIQNQGLTRTRLVDIVFSPNYDLDRTILGASNGFLVKSASRGDDWTEYGLGYKGWRASIAAHLQQMGVPLPLTRVLLTPSERREPYPTVLVPSPNFASDGLLYYGTRNHGILRSDDGGQTATTVWNGGGSPDYVSSLVMSPGFLPSDTSSGDRTLFAGIHGQGVLKTADGGASWQFVNNGLTFAENWQTGNGPSAGRTLERDHVWLAISAHYPTDQTLFAASVGGLFKSTDGGANWRQLDLPDGSSTDTYTDGMLHPADLSTQPYVAAVATSTNYGAGTVASQAKCSNQSLLVSVKGRGLYISRDGGSSFTQVGSGEQRASVSIHDNQFVQWLAFSSHLQADGEMEGQNRSDENCWQSETLCAASTEELFISTDGGDTWQVIARPVRYEDIRDVIRFEGKWQTISAGTSADTTAATGASADRTPAHRSFADGASARSITHSNAPGSHAVLSFVGTGFRWIGAHASDGGIGRITLDGDPVSEVDQFAQTHQPAAVSFAINDLAYGPHTVLIEVTGTRNPESTGCRVYVDAIDVLGTTSITR